MDSNFDFKNEQYFMSIRRDGEVAYIDMKENKITTEGFVGENTYYNLVDLIRGLQGHNISIDDFYF
jgi:hypothetical protein